MDNGTKTWRDGKNTKITKISRINKISKAKVNTERCGEP